MQNHLFKCLGIDLLDKIILPMQFVMIRVLFNKIFSVVMVFVQDMSNLLLYRNLEMPLSFFVISQYTPVFCVTGRPTVTAKPLRNSAETSILTLHCRCTDQTKRERTANPPSFADVNNMKSPLANT